MQISLRDIHHYSRRLERAVANLTADTSVREENKKTIMSYIKYREAQGLSIPRQVRYIFTLSKLSTLLENYPFENATKNDLVNVISQIEREDTSHETKRTEKECIKCFYRWIKDGEDGENYPSEVRWIQTKRSRSNVFLPENLLTEDEVKRMAESCNNPRDRALILLIYETGGRVGEILSLSLGAISFDKYGAILTLVGKTGGRRVRIIFSAATLAEWLNHHPIKDDPDSPLWTSFDEVASKRRLEYGAFRKMLSSTAKRCGIKKRVNPHSFRHARASNLANVLTEAQMKEYLGWVGDSKMAAIYVHLSGRNVDNALFKLNGIRTEDDVNEEERPLKARHCERCREVNSPTNRFCSKCGSPLDVRTALEVQNEQEKTDEIMNKLFEDPKFRMAVEQALKDSETFS
jgi:site-specific recombinase XerD